MAKEKRYGLVYSFQESNLALEKTLQFLEDEKLKASWQKKREKLLDEKIDVTKFMIDFIENYPDSFDEYKRRQREDAEYYETEMAGR